MEQAEKIVTIHSKRFVVAADTHSENITLHLSQPIAEHTYAPMKIARTPYDLIHTYIKGLQETELTLGEKMSLLSPIIEQLQPHPQTEHVRDNYCEHGYAFSQIGTCVNCPTHNYCFLQFERQKQEFETFIAKNKHGRRRSKRRIK